MNVELPGTIWAMLASCTDPSREDEFNRWYNRTHIPDLLEIPGVKAAFRYRNLRPHRRPDEPGYLAIYDIDAPDAWALLKTMLQEYGPKWHAQGRMIDCLKANYGSAWQMITSKSTVAEREPSGATLADGMPGNLVFGLTACGDPAREKDFNDWYDNTHLPDLLKVPGVARAYRYKNIRWKPQEGEPRYLAIYNLDSKKPLEVLKQMDKEVNKLAEQGRMIDYVKITLIAPFGHVGP